MGSIRPRILKGPRAKPLRTAWDKVAVGSIRTRILKGRQGPQQGGDPPDVAVGSIRTRILKGSIVVGASDAFGVLLQWARSDRGY